MLSIFEQPSARKKAIRSSSLEPLARSALHSRASSDRVLISGFLRFYRSFSWVGWAKLSEASPPSLVNRSLDGGHGANAPLPTLRIHAVSRSRSAHTGTWSDGFSQPRT